MRERLGSWLHLLVLLSLAALMPPAWSRAAAAGTASGDAGPLIAFLTDYGTLDDAVALCKGVMLTIAPHARIVDITHQVKPYSIADGARYLARAAQYFPPTTIFVGVVDPGVGTARRAIIARSKRGQYFVVPDNGLLTLIEDRDGIESAREITNPHWMLAAISSTFHGRDIFAPAAAHLARGEDWSTAGPLLPHLVRLQLSAATLAADGISGGVVALDGPFGNLISNVGAERLRQLGYRRGDQVRVRIGSLQLTVRYAKTFGDVPVGDPLLYVDSSGLVGIAINQGNFANVHHIAPPASFFIAAKRPPGGP